ncbi:MAG: hypothetical protein AB1716_19365 [Planctomycetota bacterium]
MSAIPPNWLGSIIQTQSAQARAAQDKNRAAGATAEQVDASFADRLTAEIEASDRDSQVYADAEGTGSQGRPFEDRSAEQPPDDTPAPPPPGGLDVQA